MSASKSLSPSSLIMQMNSAFPKDDEKLSKNNFQTQSGVMILLILAFLMFAISNSKNATIVLICGLCLSVGYFYYTNNLTAAVDKFLELLGISKKLESHVNKIPKSDKSKKDAFENIDVEPVKPTAPPVFPPKIEPGKKLYKPETPAERIDRLEKRSKISMFRDFNVVQPPVGALNALRKGSYLPSTKRSIHEVATPPIETKESWNASRGNELIKEQLKNSKLPFKSSV